MTYVDGFVAAVPTANREIYKKHAEAAAVVFKEHGAMKLVECGRGNAKCQERPRAAHTRERPRCGRLPSARFLMLKLKGRLQRIGNLDICPPMETTWSSGSLWPTAPRTIPRERALGGIRLRRSIASLAAKRCYPTILQFSVSILASCRPALDVVRGQRRRKVRLTSPLLRDIICLAGAHSFGPRSMSFWARLSVYAGVVVLYVGTAAWIVRSWIRKRYRDKSPSDLHYIAVGIVLVVSAGLGVLVASQIVVVLGYTG
jgi:hypothetical protein